jgi:anti-sigma factor RsiW
VVELVTDYLEGALSPEDRARFEDHIANYCDKCRTYLEQMRAVLRITGSIPEESLSEEARSQLMQTFRGWRRRAQES